MSLPYQGECEITVIGVRIAVGVGGKEMQQEGWMRFNEGVKDTRSEVIRWREMDDGR